MRLEFKFKDVESCEECPCHIYKPRPSSGGLIPPDLCQLGYDINHRLIRPKKCIEENGE